MFQFNRELAARGIEWIPRSLYFLEAWNYPGVSSAMDWNFRTGIVDEEDIEDWLNQTGDFSMPVTPAGVGTARGGIRLLACNYTLFKRASVRMSREAFELVESRFHLHPATLHSLEVAGAFLNICQSECGQLTDIAIIVKVPQKYEIGNHMLSLTHHSSSRWTTALLAGESIVDTLLHVQHPTPETLGRLSPCAVIREYLIRSPWLWNHPLTLPCIVLTDHLRRLQLYCARDLTPSVMSIEEQLGVTRVGRRGAAQVSRGVRGIIGSAGRPVERMQAEHLTVEINTEVTRVRFTSAAPKWNHEASLLIIGIARELDRLVDQMPNSDHEIIGLLEHNINIAKSLEDHVLGLQRRLELQLNVLYSFVAQTDNRLSARLAATAGRDSTSMKILAFITTIFLPGTFVATLFSMNMFNWEDQASDRTVSSKFWIYWAVTAPLTVVTIGGWGLWWSFEKHRYDEHLKSTVKSAGEVNTPPWWQRLLRIQQISRPEKNDFPVVIPVDARENARQRVRTERLEPRASRSR